MQITAWYKIAGRISFGYLYLLRIVLFKYSWIITDDAINSYIL